MLNTNTSINSRIKLIRSQLGYSRRIFSEKFGISAATLQAWEDGINEISPKSIDRYISCLNKEGISVTHEWLMTGKGAHPELIPLTNKKISLKTESFFEDEIILKEVDFFERINKNPVIVLVPDDAMHPLYSVGDYVGGNFVTGKEANNFIGLNCIIIVEDGTLYIRKLKQGHTENSFNLIGTNLDSCLPDAFMTGCKVISIAEIVWHRKSSSYC